MKFNIFRIDKSIKSYTYPVVKILTGIVLIILLINSNHIFLIHNRAIYSVVNILCAVIVLVCVFCICISGAELIIVSEKRAKDKFLLDSDIANCKEYTIDKIISMVESNDIIEIYIASGKRIVEIGSSSYSESVSSKLTDKRYYIDKEEFIEIEDFKSALLPYLIDQKLLVFSIDGVKAKKLKNQSNAAGLSQSNASYTICFDGMGKNKFRYENIKEVIKHFTSGGELFFGHYRTDGFNITNEEFLQYGLDIPEYFNSNGIFQRITKSSGGKIFGPISTSPQELTVCCAPANAETYEIMDKVFHYYLETTVFCPKIDWETFVNVYGDYMENGSRDYIEKGYTDFLFAYVDSGIFSVTFDPKRNDPNKVEEEIQRILES